MMPDFKTCTRAEWDAYQQRLVDNHVQSHGFDPRTPWHVATWRERCGIVFFHAIMWGVVFPAMLIGALWLLGTLADGFVKHKADYEQCLQQATNGLEIKRCG